MDTYDDIINLPHHVSTTRPRMPLENRAAQFSPFQALTGYEDAVVETARLTDRRIELDEDAIEILELKFAVLADRLDEHPEVVITYFQPDERKEGGTYIPVAGIVKKIDDVDREILLMSGMRICIQDIINIESDIFKTLSGL